MIKNLSSRSLEVKNKFKQSKAFMHWIFRDRYLNTMTIMPKNGFPYLLYFCHMLINKI